MISYLYLISVCMLIIEVEKDIVVIEIKGTSEYD